MLFTVMRKGSGTRFTDQQTLLFYRRLYRSDNYILRILLGLRKYRVAALLSKYGIFSVQTQCKILSIVYGRCL